MIAQLKKKYLFFIALGTCLFIATSCEKVESDKLETEKSYLYSLMKDVYYWYKEMPTT
jgi:hypothetical protein